MEPSDTSGERSTRESDAVDLDSIRGHVEPIHACESARAVREELARIAFERLPPDAVGVYRREGDRYRVAAERHSRAVGPVPTALPGANSPLADAIESGETRHGAVVDDAFGDAADYCVTPLNGHGAVLLLSDGATASDESVRAGLSLLVGHAEAALVDVEGGTIRRAAAPDSRPDVSEETLLDRLSHAFPDYAYILDGDGTYLDVLLGIRTIRLDATDDLVGGTVHDVFDAEEADRIVAAIRAALRTGEEQRLEYTQRDGERPLHYEGHIAPLPLEEAESDAAILVARDVTGSHERERNLRRQNERLEEFASIVSHDLRNPLTTASGFLDLVSEDVDDERLDRVRAAHDRMEALIDDLLALARNERPVTESEPVDLRTAAQRAWGTVSVDGALDVGDTLTIRADPTRFGQVLENLFRNTADHASDAPAPPDPSVHIGALPDDEGFYVADDGRGIPSDERDDVFESGYTSVPDGTGLGLAIVERVADAHGWTVRAVESDDGGARFEFRGVDVVEAERPT